MAGSHRTGRRVRRAALCDRPVLGVTHAGKLASSFRSARIHDAPDRCDLGAYREGTMDHRVKRFTKEGCVECARSICDECGPSKKRLAWLWSQFTWHANRTNVGDMHRRPWHRQQAEWYYLQMHRDEHAMSDMWGIPATPTAWHREPPGSVPTSVSAGREERPSPETPHSNRSDTPRSLPTSVPSG